MHIYTFASFDSARFVYQQKTPKSNNTQKESQEGMEESEKSEVQKATKKELNNLKTEIPGMREAQELQTRTIGVINNFERSLNEGSFEGQYKVGISSHRETGDIYAGLDFNDGERTKADIIQIEAYMMPGKNTFTLRNYQISKLFDGPVSSYVSGPGEIKSSMPAIDRQLEIHEQLLTTSYPHLRDISEGVRSNYSLMRGKPEVRGDDFVVAYTVKAPQGRDENGKMQFETHDFAQVRVAKGEEYPIVSINGGPEAPLFGEDAAQQINDEYQATYAKEQWSYGEEISQRTEAFEQMVESTQKPGFTSISKSDVGQIHIFKYENITGTERPDVMITYQPETWTWLVTINSLVDEGKWPSKHFASNESENIQNYLEENFYSKNEKK